MAGSSSSARARGGDEGPVVSAERRVIRLAFDGPAGRLEGLLHVPPGPARFRAVVAHPHPLFGGTMDNKVAYRVARSLEDGGGIVLRFNFRGAGASEGEHDRGRGEQDDLRAAIARVLAATEGEGASPDVPLILAGFSFGSAMASRVACSGTPRVSGLLLIGCPVLSHAFEELTVRPAGMPVGFIQGERDEHGPVVALRELQARLVEPTRLVIVPAAGHFFDAHQPELASATSDLIAFLLAGSSDARD